MRRYRWIGMTLLLILVFVPLVKAKVPTAKIIIKSIPPAQKMQDAEGNPIVTSGLSNVGKGTHVFLEAIGEDPDGGSITSYLWKLSKIPSGSKATLSDMDSKVTSFIPDLVGQYTVELIVTDDQGEKSLTATVTISAGTWVGVGTVGGAKPDITKGQCAVCHPKQAESWAKTGHATMFQKGITGKASSHYAERCINCHTVGFDVAAGNEGFDDIATKLGWKFPEKLKEDNWQNFIDNYPELAQLANIQCENCHGPGSEHKGDKSKIAVSFESGVCGQCHDAPTHHMKNYQWRQSKHTTSIYAAGGFVVTQDRCVHCHTAQGFSKGLKATEIKEPAPITCSTCHDPHSADNEYQLRFFGAIEIAGLEVEAGPAAVCMKCHNAHGASVGREPHHPQAEMLVGVGGYEYPGETYESGAHSVAIEEKCITCHMSPTPKQGEPGANQIGEHTWKMENEGVYNVTGCKSCHGPLSNFDVNGIQSRIKSLLAKLEELLPKKEGEVLVDSTDDITLTDVQKRAAFNYYFVKNDGSLGVHNPRYAEKLLIDSIKSLTGEEPAKATTKTGCGI